MKTTRTATIKSSSLDRLPIFIYSYTFIEKIDDNGYFTYEKIVNDEITAVTSLNKRGHEYNEILADACKALNHKYLPGVGQFDVTIS